METSALSKASQRTNLPIWLNVTFTKTSTDKVYNKSELKKEHKKKANSNSEITVFNSSQSE